MILKSDLLATYTSFYRFENTLHLGLQWHHRTGGAGFSALPQVRYDTSHQVYNPPPAVCSLKCLEAHQG